MITEEAYVVSDLHLGAGEREPALEDFRQDAELARFARAIAAPGVTLFINGDFIDFPQIPPYDVPRESHLLWDEAASLQKLDAAIEAHGASFDGLAELLRKGGALRIHVGNHDLDLAWPSVQERLRRVLGAPSPEALEFSRAGSTYHGVRIEHGHMFTPENAPAHPVEFIHQHPTQRGRFHLERVWGTDFMLQFYNDLERRHPFADNVKPMVTVALQGLRKGWIGGREVVRLVLFLKRRGVPLDAVASSVLAGDRPGVDQVIGSFQEPEWQAGLMDRLAEDEAFRDQIEGAIASLSPAEQAIVARGETVEVGSDAPAEQGATLGLFREEREVRAARAHLAKPGITHVVFGHTHRAVDGALDGHLFNPGTWLPHLNLREAHVAEKIRASGLTLDILSDASLYVVERTVVHIVPDATHAARVELALAR